MQRGHSTSSLGILTSRPLKMSGFGGAPAFSFGSASTSAPASAFGGFGTPATSSFGTPAPTTGFGAPAATGFGGFGTPSTTTFGAPAATGFGAPAATGFGAPAATGFGAPAATGFGAPSATGFGAPAATGFGAPAATGFGAPAATGFGAPAAAGFSGFGAPAATGFGAPAAAGFSGFGAPAATGFGAPAATGFGAPAATGFGAPAATGFGAPAATGFGAPAAAGFSGFGAPAANSFGGFGAQAATGFGAAPTASFGTFGAPPAASGIGAPVTNAFGGFGASAGAAALPSITHFLLGDRILDIQLSYAPLLDSQTGLPAARATSDRHQVANEAICKFDTIMYNPKPLGGNTRMQSNSGSRWEQAERDNPDPEALEAVRELGIDALKKRFEAQNRECVKYRAHTADLRSIIEGVDTSTRQTGLRVEALQLKQAQLYNKMLSVVRTVEVLRCQGVPIDSSERRYREKLDRMMVALQFPYSKLQELSVIGSQRERPHDVFSDSMSEEDVEAMCSVLKKQRDGLQHLTDILTKDARDIMIVKQRLKSHTQLES